MPRPGSFLSRIIDRLRSLPRAALLVIGVSVGLTLVIGAIGVYRTYDYVQHDNQFCMECHLMREPFERFARSVHRDLGCKACHRPNLLQRSQMGLAQVVEQPDEIRVHAEVPNEICAECHIEGDPERWLMVASTAGHRVHLESEDPALGGLLCVECHSSSVHEFTPTDRTCGQGGCHESTTIQLGSMADLTIHCATCHDFTAPTRPGAGSVEVASALSPVADQCMSCHQMRALFDLPPDEPHGAECGICHDPHRQATPHQAIESCATAECHAQPELLTPLHRGLATGALEDCVACHTAHDFRVHQPADCLSCHTDIDDAPPPRTATAAASTSDFRHGEHRDVGCTTCHAVDSTHGETLVTGIADCRACHHTAPLATRCESCHEPADRMTRLFPVRQTLDIRVGRLDRPVRDLPFDHRRHASTACTTCHVDGLHLGTGSVSCSSCHQQHHEPTTTCTSCHLEPREGAHDPQVHLGCVDCHEAMPQPVRGVPRTREFCLVCHQGLRDHRPGQSCEQCHALPRPASGP